MLKIKSRFYFQISFSNLNEKELNINKFSNFNLYFKQILPCALLTISNSVKLFKNIKSLNLLKIRNLNFLKK